MASVKVVNLTGIPTGTLLDNLKAGSANAAFVNTTLNAALKNSMVQSLDNGGYPALSGLVQKMAVVDIAANQDKPLQVFLKAELDPMVANDPEMKKAVDSEVANLSDSVTLGTFLNLNQPIQASPLFQPEINKAQIVELLSTAPSLNNAGLQNDFIGAYMAFKGKIQDFWTQLGQNTEFKSAIPQIQLSLQLGAFTFNNIPLVQAIQSAYKPSVFRNLSSLTADQLTQLINSQNIQVPSSIPGATPTEKTSNYVGAMMRVLSAAFPTDLIAKEFKSSKDILNQAVGAFLTNSPDFDFAATNVDAYLKANSAAAFKGISADQVQLTNRIKAVQRVFRVDSDPTLIQTLTGQGLDSARKIASIPQSQFLGQYSTALGGTSTALLVYNGARQIAGTVSHLYRGIQETLQKENPAFIGNYRKDFTDDLTQVIPNWQTLFGSTSFCQCDECSAMDGPAAYFVDLLQFLQFGDTNNPDPQNSAGFSPLDILIGYQNNPNNPGGTTSSTPPLGRRPDLAYLKLTCANSDTPLPYVDLINEILESYVYYVGIQNQAALPSSSNNTPSDATPNELSVNPEFTNQAVYNSTGPLVSALYPFNLPYDRYLDTARTYLNFLGSSRYQLMQSAGNFAPSQDYAAMLAAESLNMSQTEYGLITGGSFKIPAAPVVLTPLYTLYGYSSDSITQPDPTGANQTLTCEQWLVQVPEFLKRTGLAYADLISLMETQYLNPGQTITLQATGSDPCDLNATAITFPPNTSVGGQDAFFAKVPPFLRMWKKLGWTIDELDKALTALNTTTITRDFILAAAQLKQLQTSLNLPVNQLLALWSVIDADGRDSLYIGLFQNKTVINPLDEAFQLTYRTPLAGLPAALPTTWTYDNSPNRAIYDSTNKLLEFAGTMSDQELDNLLTWAAGNDTAILAVQNLFNQRWAGGTDIVALPGQAQPLICQHINTILAALQVSASDLGAIAADCGLIPPGADLNGFAWAVVAGTVTAGDTVKLTMTTRNHGVVRSLSVSYTVLQLDTLPSVATALAGLVNTDTGFQQEGISAASQADLLNLYVPFESGTTVTWGSTIGPAGAMEKVTLTLCPPLNIANLSSLFRYAVLARALNISVRDLIALKALTGINPFILAHVLGRSDIPPTNYLFEFVQAAQTVVASDFSVSQLNYLYRALPDPADGLPPLQAVQDQLAVGLSAGLQKITAANAYSPDPSGAALQKKLAVLLSSDQVAPTMALINGSLVNSVPLAALPSGAQLPTNNFITTVVIGGAITAGDTVTLTMTSTAIAGSPVSVNYAVTEGDTLNSIAANLAALVTANSALSPAGISVFASGTVITLISPTSLNPYPNWGFSAAPATSNSTATETAILTSTPQINFVTSLTIGGIITAGDNVTLTMTAASVSGSPLNIVYQVASSDSFNSIAQNLMALVNSNSVLSQAGISATVSGAVITLSAPNSLNPFPVWTAASAASSGAGTEKGVLSNALTFIGLMTYPTLLQLQKISTDVSFNTALEALYDESQNVLSENLFFLASNQVYSTPLAALPTGLASLPPVPPGQVSFVGSGSTGTLNCDGPMSNSTRDQLLGLPAAGADAAFVAAVNELYNQAWNGPCQNLAESPSTSMNYDYVLGSLLAYLERTQSQSLVKQTLSQALNLDPNLVAMLVEGDPTTTSPALLPSKIITAQPTPAMADFLGGLLGCYYTATTLTGTPKYQIDPGINLDGTEVSFGSAQWFGRIVPPTTDTYNFNLYFPLGTAAGKWQLWVDGQPLIDTTQNPLVQNSINLTVGKIYDFQFNFLQAPSAASFQIQLQWSTASSSPAAISKTAFVLGADPASAQGGNSATLVQGGIYSDLALLSRIALMVNGFSMQASEVSYLSAQPTNFSGVRNGHTVPFDLSKLPDYYPTAAIPAEVNPNQAAIDLKAPAYFNQWQRLNNLYQLKSGLPSGNTGLFDVFQAASILSSPANSKPPAGKNLVNVVLAATGWNPIDFNSLIGTAGFNLADFNFINEESMVTLAACLSLCGRLGISASQLLTWANNVPDPGEAQDMINTVKAKYPDASWVQTGKPLNDHIRENSKEALIAYILNMPLIVQMGFTDADDLYDYFLIDVQMCTCMVTSRIVQATAAVQQFIQRCLLNLENGNSNANLNIPPSAIDGTSWENWRKNYRVWQAAVQVFLYPENWIDPTLRDDRTPIFKDLQNQLLQASVTEDQAETAFLNYLESLRQVAQLDIVGMCGQTESGVSQGTENLTHAGGGEPTASGINLTHVFGRTYSAPHVYFYRYLDNTTGVWSPWEAMDVEIKGDQLIPVIWNERLFVFWPNYKEVTDPAQNPPTTSNPPSSSAKQLQITMSWSELRQGAWTKKQSTPDSVPLTPPIFDTTQGKLLSEYMATLDTTQFSYVTDVDDNGNLSITMNQNFPITGQKPNGFQQAPIGVFLFTGVQAIMTPGDITTIKNNWLENGIEGKFPFISWEAVWAPVNMDILDGAGTDLQLVNGYGYHQSADLTPDYFPVLQPISTPQLGYQLMLPQELQGNTDISGGSLNFFFQDSHRTFYAGVVPGYFIKELVYPKYAQPPYIPSQLVESTAYDPASVSIFKAPDSPKATGSAPPPTATASSGSGTPAPLAVSPKAEMLDLSRYITKEKWMGYWKYVYVSGTFIEFYNHYHPWVDEFIRILNWKEIPGLLATSTQVLGGALDPDTGDAFDFNGLYNPTSNVALPYPVEIVDTCNDGAYSAYNWELFFHIPFLIATQLSQNQQFQDAQTWFHYIFDPTTDVSTDPIGNTIPAPNRYWNFLFFNQNTQDGQIQDLLNDLMNSSSPGYPQNYKLVTQWWSNPFDPDAVARLRPVAYQKAVVMAYIDNLIAWGDNLFTQNTRESINEATQLYVLADKILGPKPVMVPPQGIVLPVAYKDLQWDSLDNALVQLENQFPFTVNSNPSGTSDSGSSVPTGSGGASTGSVPYFCTPVNSQLLGYWDTVADRLYKIRHCMNIQGQVQQLSLFAPPINPGLLVAAAAAGVDLSSVLSDINAAVPYYRFNFMLSKALELCAEVRSLGGALLSALEKKDAEALSLLRASQETAVQQAILQVKQLQVSEANVNLLALQDSLAITQFKHTYYQTLVTGGLSPNENQQVQNLTQSQNYKQIGQIAGLLGSDLSLIPQLEFGASGIASPVATVTFGGQQLSTMASMVAQAFNMQADYYSYLANLCGLAGSWDRRAAEWNFQLGSAGLEITQINDQINAANFRVQIAQQDLNNQNLQISNAQAIQDFLNNKFTDEDLYSWMIDQVSAVYFQCYQMAYDLAKRAESCFQYELGLADSNYIQFGYWDSLKQGLLSGEKMYLDLKRLEGAYLDQNKREYEITKNISLVLLDPIALITLKETGQCLVNLPESYFDMDYPGHYMRRIKSVGLTLPCVTGPYTSVNCTLTMLQSKIRFNTQPTTGGNSYLESPVGGDSRFFYNYATNQSVATSTAQGDSGMFEVNFRDERYLPFEGGGAVSQWMISMPKDCNAFDFETITDLILNLKYTARDGGTAFGSLARAAATLPGPQTQGGIGSSSAGSFPQKQVNQTRLFSLKHEFPTNWAQFFNPADPTQGQVFNFILNKERFPFQYRGKTITINQVDFFLKFKNYYPANTTPPDNAQGPLADFSAINSSTNTATQFSLTPPSPGTPNNFHLNANGPLPGILTNSVPSLSVKAQGGGWQLSLSANSNSMPEGLFNQVPGAGPNNTTMNYFLLNSAVIEDILMVCHYSTG